MFGQAPARTKSAREKENRRQAPAGRPGKKPATLRPVTRIPRGAGTVVGVGALLLTIGFAIPSAAHGGAVEARLESVVWLEADTLWSQYALGLQSEDGESYEGASTGIRLLDLADVVLREMAMAPAGDGIFLAEMPLPADHDWRIEITFEGPAGAGELGVPGHPHHDEAWQGPIVRLATVDETLVGSRADTDSLFTRANVELPTPSPTTTTTVDETTSTTAPSTAVAAGKAEGPEPSGQPGVDQTPGVRGITVSIPATSTLFEIRRNVLIRLLHVGSITMWLAGALALGFGRLGKPARRAMQVGLVGTLGSGFALLLYGTPLAFPGVFRWTELRASSYGSPYTLVLGVKLLAVAAAVGFTIAVARRGGRSFVIGLVASFVVALTALTLLSQLHLFVHG